MRHARDHIQVIAGEAAAGRVVEFTHDDGSVTSITPTLGRNIMEALYPLKPFERQLKVLAFHGSKENLEGL